MGERFLVLFNSQGNNVINNTNLNYVQYNMNWGSFLPKKYKRFHCQFIFKSVNTTTAITANALIGMNLGKVNCFDGNSMTSNLGICYPVINGTNYFYSSTNNDNNDFYIDYPVNNQITLTLKQFDNVSNLLSGGLASNLHYVLYLSLQGVEEEINTELTNLMI
jgi:hypothetical protein